MNAEITLGIDGLYAVCFPNHNEIGNKEIEEEFNKYGNVVRMSTCGKNMIFVKYRERHEAQTCYNALKNSPIFKVRAALNKRKLDDNGAIGKGDWSARRQGNGTSNDQFTTYNGGGRDGTMPSPRRPFSRDVQPMCTTDDNPPWHSRFHCSFDEGTFSTGAENGYTNRVADYRRSQSTPRDGEGRYQLLSKAERLSQVNEMEIPHLVTVEDVQLKQELSTLSVIEADVVMVSNLSPDTLQCDLYFLCSVANVDPLQIDMNKTSGQLEIIYADIYVKSIASANRLKAALNGEYFKGKQLMIERRDIVLKWRPPCQRSVNTM